MDTESCKVLVQIDDAGRVTAINSDAFVSGDGWTAIDEGDRPRWMRTLTRGLRPNRQLKRRSARSSKRRFRRSATETIL